LQLASDEQGHIAADESSNHVQAEVADRRIPPQKKELQAFHSDANGHPAKGDEHRIGTRQASQRENSDENESVEI
jgi:hypothetical protein